jgi:hypothetical protein
MMRSAISFVSSSLAPRRRPNNTGSAMSAVAAPNLATGGQSKPAGVERWTTVIPSVDQSWATMLLPTMFSLIAGSCDIIAFIGLGGLFTAHVTGSFVILIARVVAGGDASMSHILSVPVFKLRSP